MSAGTTSSCRTSAICKITQLTSDGCDTVVNGTSDWVNEEEFDLRCGFRWSPDGKKIAYWQFDTSQVRTYHLVNDTAGLYPEITSYKYPKVGETNSSCRVGVVACGGGPTRWFDTKVDPSEHYIPQMEWSPDSRHVVFQQLNRLQNTCRVIRGDAATGETRVIFTDRDDAWVDAMEKWNWIEDGRRFLWLSERDGWRHLYAVSRSGKKVRLLTPGPFDVIRIVGVDEERGCVYFDASPENPTQCYLYRVPLDGSGRLDARYARRSARHPRVSSLRGWPLGVPHVFAHGPAAAGRVGGPAGTQGHSHRDRQCAASRETGVA